MTFKNHKLIISLSRRQIWSQIWHLHLKSFIVLLSRQVVFVKITENSNFFLSSFKSCWNHTHRIRSRNSRMLRKSHCKHLLNFCSWIKNNRQQMNKKHLLHLIKIWDNGWRKQAGFHKNASVSMHSAALCEVKVTNLFSSIYT